VSLTTFMSVFSFSSIFFSSEKRPSFVSVFSLNSLSSSYLSYSFAFLRRSLCAKSLAFLSSISAYDGPELLTAYLPSSSFSAAILFYSNNSFIESWFYWFDLSYLFMPKLSISISFRLVRSLFTFFYYRKSGIISN
jgi:hypothetical protein